MIPLRVSGEASPEFAHPTLGCAGAEAIRSVRGQDRISLLEELVDPEPDRLDPRHVGL